MNNRTIVKNGLAVGSILIAAVVTGCASSATRVEEDFGNSVRAMKSAQTMNPEASEDMRPVMTTDGQRMDNALQTLRDYVGSPERITEDIDLNVSDD